MREGFWLEGGFIEIREFLCSWDRLVIGIFLVLLVFVLKIGGKEINYRIYFLFFIIIL